MMKKAAESGLKWMEVGVESGVNKILGLMEKGQTTDDIEQVMRTTHNNNIGLSINWIPAFPQENSMDFYASVKSLYLQEGIIGSGAGSLFVFKGKYRAVLITYPKESEKIALFDNIDMEQIMKGLA